MLWSEAKNPVGLQEALDSLFGGTPWRATAEEVFRWFTGHLPYRCGVRLGQDRITFLVGNYRPAALEKIKGRLRVNMMFAGGLPKGFRIASDVWKSIPGTTEGCIILGDLPLPLSEEDVGRFLQACNLAKDVAPKSRLWECNVVVEWPDRTPWP